MSDPRAAPRRLHGKEGKSGSEVKLAATGPESRLPPATQGTTTNIFGFLTWPQKVAPKGT